MTITRHPFLAATLNRQLEQAAREIFASERYFQRDDEQRVVYESAVLDFYTEDFVASGNARDLAQYFNPYMDSPAPDDYEIRFLQYDWTINQQPGK